MRKPWSLSLSAAPPAEQQHLDGELARALLVISSFSGGASLERLLPTARLPAQCIVVLDQGSTDDTNAVCARYGVEVVQLNMGRTEAQLGNLALTIARDRGACFVFIARNDIRLVTDATRELLYEMLRDPRLAIVSCAHVLSDDAQQQETLTYRAFWDLSTTEFHHDRSLPPGEVYRLEADFCEVAFACIRVEAADAVAGFDEAFDTQNADADFGFRLRAAGWNAAYLPQSQIQRFEHSGVGRASATQRLDQARTGHETFAAKHLGYGLRYANHRSRAPTSWGVINNNLFPTLRRSGLLDRTRPELFFSHPGAPKDSVLYTVWETSRVPERWLAHTQDYRATYLPSRWNLDVFREAGFDNVHYVPLGVDTDLFQPWGPIEPPGWVKGEFTVLWFARDQYRKGLDVMLAAWETFRHRHPTAQLIVMGHGVLERSGLPRRDARHWQQFLIHEDRERAITYREIVRPLSDADVALLYRSVDCVALTSRAEGFGFPVVEALACGTLTVFPDYGSTRDMVFDGALTFTGQEISADYSDKNFADVGTWWEPDAVGVLAAMERAITLSASERRDQLVRGLALVRGQFTWRHTAFAIRADLVRWQEQQPARQNLAILPIAGPDDMVAFARALPSPRGAIFGGVGAADLDAIFAAFDPAYYEVEYTGIEWAEVAPLANYIVSGWISGRTPSQHFDSRAYLAADERVRATLLAIHGGLDEASNRAAVDAFTAWEAAQALAIARDPTATDERFLRATYHLLLHRPPDPGGLAYFRGLIGSDPAQRAQVVDHLRGAPEYLNRVAAAAEGMRAELV